MPVPTEPLATPILQFGTSRFLQAHADLMISEALERGQAAGPITIAQSSGHTGRAGRLSALCAPEGFIVRIQGVSGGKILNHEKRVTSVRRALSTATDWPAICALMEREVTHVLSNTGDAGYDPSPADQQAQFDQAMSFPAKLLHLLLHRFSNGGAPITVMPLELVSQNGTVLRRRVAQLAQHQTLAFREWLDSEVTWVNSLVDRIVSQPLEPAGAVAEPYMLWAVENQPGLQLPCRHPALKLVDDLSQTEALKLFILNLSHTCLADRWLQTNGPAGLTVAKALDCDETEQWLCNLIETEVLPGFAGNLADATRYWHDTLERFRNPFLDHRLSDIAQNHGAKIQRRVVGFLRTLPSRHTAPVLCEIASRQQPA